MHVLSARHRAVLMSSSTGRGRCGQPLRPNDAAAFLAPPLVPGVCPRAATVPCLFASKDSLLRYVPKEVGSSPPVPNKRGQVQRRRGGPRGEPAGAIATSQPGESCSAACARDGRVCHAAAFATINACNTLSKHLPCDQGCMVRAQQQQRGRPIGGASGGGDPLTLWWR